MRAVLYDDSVADAHGTRILVAGIDTARYLKNPVVLVQHDTDSLPIGRAVRLWVEGSRLVAELEFDPGDAYAAEINRKLLEGYLNAFSINVLPVAYSEAPADRLPGQRGLTLTRAELFEVSVVTLPSHPDALVSRSAFPYYLSHQNAEVMENKTIEIGKLARALALPGAVMDETEIIGQLEGLIAECGALRRRVAELGQAELRAKIDGLLSRAVAERRILAGEVESLAKLAATEYAEVEKLIGQRPATRSITGQLAERAAQGLAQERAAWTFEDWQKRDAKGLAALRADRPEEYQRLLDELRAKTTTA